jgi:ankyrin repeat protein
MPQKNTHLKIIPLLILVTALWATAGCEKKPDPSQDLLEAAAHGDLVEVKNLLEAGVNINAKNENGITALMLAATSGYGDIVELLLAQGADSKAKNNYGETALEVTSDKKIKALLREHGQLTQIVSPTALCRAARMGDIIAVKNYLDKGGDINSNGQEGLTALIEASSSGEKDMVELLYLRLHKFVKNTTCIILNF